MIACLRWLLLLLPLSRVAVDATPCAAGRHGGRVGNTTRHTAVAARQQCSIAYVLVNYCPLRRVVPPPAKLLPLYCTVPPLTVPQRARAGC